MAKRHTLQRGEWASVFGRLEELVLANSGEDEFEEIFKIVIAKLYLEKTADRTLSFDSSVSPEALFQNTNMALRRAHDQWPGIFDSDYETRLTPEHLAVCVQVFEGIALSEASFEVLDNLFEFLASRVAKGAKGQYFTPRYIIDFCIKALRPAPHELLVDPACGSGGFLVHALNYVRELHGEKEAETYCASKLWGFDFESRAVKTARALMLLAGDGRANIHRLNSLLTQDILLDSFAGGMSIDGMPKVTIEDIVKARTKRFRGFDIVVTNPPFAGGLREASILAQYELAAESKRVERDILFLERCVNLLRPGGRIAIVLPHNKIGGKAWAAAREWLFRRLQVVGVLGLGRHTFLPHTSQKACVLFGVKRERTVRCIPDEKILFMISEKDGKDSKGRLIERPDAELSEPAWQRVDHDLDALAEAFSSFIKSETVTWEAA